MKNIIQVLSILMLCCPIRSIAEEKVSVFEIYFEHDSYAVDPDLGENDSSISSFTSFIDTVEQESDTPIERIEIDSSTSPEGGKTYNDRLAERRSIAIREYLLENNLIADSLVRVSSSGLSWTQMYEIVENSSMADKDQILAILKDISNESMEDETIGDKWDSTLYRLNEYLIGQKDDQSYEYMMGEIYPRLRRSTIVATYIEEEEPSIPVVVEPEVEEVPVVVEEVVNVAEPAQADEKLILAIKTNLLYDVALTPNIEVEVPIRSSFSLNGELGRGWWLRENTRCWELLYAGVEGRYWFGDRSKRDQLTGWFVGVFANAGICDFQFKDASGVQSDFYIALGLSGGYSLRLSKRWMMEFSVGAGYLENEYQKYWVEDDETLIEDGQTVSRQSLLPLKAKVSIGWLLFNRRK